MPYTYYHTGTRRDARNKDVFRKISDSRQVQVEGWDNNGRPYDDDGRDFVLWYFFDDPRKNVVFNWNDHTHYFVCEY